MTAEVINLRLARKARTRADREATAAANRAAFGRTKAEKAAARAEIDRRNRDLEGARREP
ncbi:DUF4169 family protein [Hephaestia sp. GCM10023244]|uniref:DUF4169 family protein n=1 Tax=unclassified Hephaestia TaxID=2631281 RepID=UPI0020772175|nr:DUF4169 family protein [Hephaestia sp. MAHUQ-44]MCM8729899.1 DUF4169 family protein [Hephaestia sp. MAHUQ-44]